MAKTIATPKPSTPITAKLAATIMGSNFHGIGVTERHLGVKFTTKQKQVLATVPFGPAVLKACSGTHVLVACASLSLLDVWQSCNGLFATKSGVWCQQQRFATIKIKAGWQLVRKSPVLGSISQTWDKQQTLLGPDEQVPSASVLAQTILIHFLETKEHLFEWVSVRSSDVGFGGRRVYLGYFYQGGLSVYGHWGGHRGSYLGLASFLKSS